MMKFHFLIIDKKSEVSFLPVSCSQRALMKLKRVILRAYSLPELKCCWYLKSKPKSKHQTLKILKGA